jgi:hypothetical protein
MYGGDGVNRAPTEPRPPRRRVPIRERVHQPRAGEHGGKAGRDDQGREGAQRHGEGGEASHRDQVHGTLSHEDGNDELRDGDYGAADERGSEAASEIRA